MRVKSITLIVAEAVDRQIAALARRQRGYVTRQQLLGLGVGREAINRRVKLGRLIPVYAGVYAVGHLPTLPQDRAAGAVLACGPNAVLSHRSAASLWGIFKDWRMPVEVTVPTARHPRGVRVHRAALERQDIRTYAGLRVTSPARTLLDLGPRMAEKARRRAVNDLRRAGQLRLHHLEDVLRRFPRHPGASRLRPFVDGPRDNPTGYRHPHGQADRLADDAHAGARGGEAVGDPAGAAGGVTGDPAGAAGGSNFLSASETAVRPSWVPNRR